MKPIKLTMRAFGPYKNEEVIDFSELQNNRLFVISGSTGAGKTTIFDGICFALFGFGSGQDRKDTKMMRSDFAQDDVHTAVELIFEIHGKTYRVLRQLPHVKEGRKSATGEKYELFEIQDGQEVPVVERQRVTDINQKLEDIIGLSYDQFNQIVMLPQGEFRKLLTSQSDNKEEILRKIFKTNRYGEMTQRLEEKKKQAEQKLNEARLLKNSYIAQLEGVLPKRESLLFTVLNQNSNIYQIQDALDEEVQYYQQKIKEDQKIYDELVIKYKEKYEFIVAKRNLNERIDAYEKKVQKLNVIEQQKPYFEQINNEYQAAIRASRIKPLNEQCLLLHEQKQQQQQRLNVVLQKLEKAREELAIANEAFQNELSKQNERDYSVQQVLEIQKLLSIFEGIEKQSSIVQTLQKEVNEARTSFERIEQQLLEKREQVATLTMQIEKLELRNEKLNHAMAQQMNLREVVNTFANYNELTKKVTLLKELYAIASKEYEEVKKAYDVEETKWLSNQAAILAASLIPGSPCPVCGSNEHKTVDRQHVEIIDEKALKVMKAKLSTAEQSKYVAEANVNAAIDQLTQCQNELKRLDASIEQQQQFIEQFNAINEFVKQLQNESDQLAQYKKQLKQLHNSTEQQEQLRKQVEEEYRQKQQQLIKENTVLEQHKSLIPSEFQQLSQVRQALIEAEKRRNQLQFNWENAQKQLQQAEKNQATNEEALKQTELQLKQIEENLERAKEEFKQSMAASNFANYKQFEASIRTESEQQQLQHQYVQYTNELHALTIQVQEESKLLEGEEKVDLALQEQQLSELEVAREKAHEALNFSKECERSCIDFSEKLDRIVDEIYQLEEVSNQIVDLYNLLRGQNSKKISFERYVQMGYLEQITEAANIRLRNLSNGQYFLQCSDRQESHGRQSGLSLDVYDTYTGQSRDVKSLSGGEKFNASLCLALGMADVIQSFQGNVRIDTMFIDEGFGSLDEESLMKAIDTLIDLQKTGRMIGVISHVSELKAAMPAILHVEKSKEGYSRTKITVK